MEAIGQREEPRQFGLPMAVGISVGLHLLVLLLSLWLPLVGPTQAAPPLSDETVLRFSFAPETSSETDLDARPSGEVPVETPQPPQPEQSPALPQLVPPQAGDLGDPLPPRQSAPPAVPQTEPFDDPAEEEPPRQEPDDRRQQEELEQTPAEAAESDIAGAELPNDAAATLRSGAPEAEASGQTRSFDLNRALEDFGQALDRAREASERNSSDRQGTSNNVFVPDLSSVPSAGYGIGNLVFETRDYDWSEYASQIYWAIWKAWHSRLYASVADFDRWANANTWFLEHAAQIRFVIERDGDVTGISVEGPSGCGPLDASAFEALDEVVLPPLPADFPKDREVVHARFIAIGEIRGMRQTLAWLRANGFF